MMTDLPTGWRFIGVTEDEADALTARGLTPAMLTAPLVSACRRFDGALDLDLLRQRLGRVKMLRDALAVGVAEEVSERFPAFKGAGEAWVSKEDAHLMVGLGVVFVD